MKNLQTFFVFFSTNRTVTRKAYYIMEKYALQYRGLIFFIMFALCLSEIICRSCEDEDQTPRQPGWVGPGRGPTWRLEDAQAWPGRQQGRRTTISWRRLELYLQSNILVMILLRLSLLVSSLGLLLSSLSLLPAMMIHFKQANLGSFLPFTTTLKVNTQHLNTQQLIIKSQTQCSSALCSLTSFLFLSMFRRVWTESTRERESPAGLWTISTPVFTSWKRTQSMFPSPSWCSVWST